MEIKAQEIEEEFNKLMSKLGPVFFSTKGFMNAKNYIRGLLGPVERKNGWQMSEYLCEGTPYKLQHFLYSGEFSADEMRDIGRKYVEENLGEDDGIMVVDDTGIIKQGKKSCGVQRQYSGSMGKVGNCQIGVFLTYASKKGHAPIDRRLYMPESWIGDEKRLKEAGVPEGLKFQTKPQMALEMIKEATAAGVSYNWVTGDCAYGDYEEIRQWLEEKGKNYVMCVSRKEYIWDGSKQVKVGDIVDLVKALPEDEWFEASCGDGSKGARVYEWITIELKENNQAKSKAVDFKQWSMLVRRSKSDKTDVQAYICYAPKVTPETKFVEVAGTRWTVETCFKESKGEVGLDQYEVRSYNGWYKHITFACIALAFLTVLSSNSFDTKSMQEHNPSTSSLEDFKKKRNLRV